MIKSATIIITFFVECLNAGSFGEIMKMEGFDPDDFMVFAQGGDWVSASKDIPDVGYLKELFGRI